MLTGSQLDNLKQYFSRRTDVAFAFLFGSQTGSYATTLSDVDLAVYFVPDKKHPIEYETATHYSMENKVWSDVMGILKKEVDLVVLNRVPATVATSALRGVPLTINDWGLYLDFMEAVTAEGCDFMDFIIKDFMERGAIEKRG